MIDLNQFPPDIYQTLIGLPYRVGLYVSLSDRTGGSESDASELAALENVVTFYVEDTLKSEFAQSIMLGTLQHKAHWSNWGNEIDKLPSECEDMIGYLTDRVEARDLIAFKNNLLEIAMAVALAYREEQAEAGFLGRLKNLFWPKPVDEASAYFNISAAEKIAINTLAGIFGINQKIS